MEPVLAAYSAEQGNQPARIVLIKVPEKTEMRQKNMLNVSGEHGRHISSCRSWPSEANIPLRNGWKVPYG